MRSVRLDFQPVSLPAPGTLRAEAGEIHVWRASLEAPPARVQEYSRTLSADERERVRRLRHARHRRRATVSRGLLRRILAGYTGVRPRELRFRYGARGKPALEGASAVASVHFNLSHSADLLVVAVAATRPLGVDVERVRPVPDAGKIARRLGAGPERRGPGTERVTDPEPGPADDAAAFLLWWTRREACAKAAGVGLPARPGGARAADTDEAADTAKWRCYRFAPAPGYVGALAITGHGWRLVPRNAAP